MEFETIVTRQTVPKKPSLSILEHIYVEKGAIEDWRELQELHYKGHTLAAGSRFMRCVYDDGINKSLIGIMAFGMPRPLDRDRMRIFPHLKPNQDGVDTKLMNQQRMRWINKNLTWNNRTVLDTMYRGGGIAYRFKNLAYRMFCSGYRMSFVESRSSMGKFNPFSIKAGMQFTKPTTANALSAGLGFFAGHFKASPYDSVALLDELEAMPVGQRSYTETKLREFYYRHSAQEKSGDKRDLGMTRVNELTIPYIIKQTQQLAFGATIYWLWQNPDVKKNSKGRVIGWRVLPERIPLLAFDQQGPTEPMTFQPATYSYPLEQP